MTPRFKWFATFAFVLVIASTAATGDPARGQSLPQNALVTFDDPALGQFATTTLPDPPPLPDPAPRDVMFTAIDRPLTEAGYEVTSFASSLILVNGFSTEVVTEAPLAVPGPIAGTGLPALLMGVGAALGLWRDGERCHRPQPKSISSLPGDIV